MKVTNTLTGQKEEFVPAGDPVRMYVCGVTPYDSAHVGHAMSYIVFDVIRRYLEFRGYRVRHVQNFTDIDDKIIARAQRLGLDPLALAERYIAEYFADMDALNIKRAHVYPRATQEIPMIITIIQGLLRSGCAYVVDGDVYFRVAAKPDYGKLSKRTPDELLAGARVEIDPRKENPMDFALWKAAKPGEPSWPSPWGPGRPGWHIECSAMSLRYLGEEIDIHGGGQDLIFPHHENEIAQSECYTHHIPFVRYWIHNGLMQFAGTKMAKSVGNVITIKEVLQHHSADALRLFVLQSHYRRPLNFSDEGLEAAERGVERLRTAAGGEAIADPEPRLPEAAPATVEEAWNGFLAAMDDDFNTPQALAHLFELASECNRLRDSGAPAETLAAARQALRTLAGVLGFTLRPRVAAEDLAARPFIDLLVEVRSELRRARQYDLADRIRARLSELGIVLEDRPEGTVWRRAGA